MTGPLKDKRWSALILLGLAVVASLADARTDALRTAGSEPVAALNGGYQLAFLVGAVFAGVAAIMGTRLRPTQAARAAEAAQVQA